MPCDARGILVRPYDRKATWVYTMGLREHVDRLDVHELNGEVPEYADDPEAFTLAMEGLADNLEHIGL